MPVGPVLAVVVIFGACGGGSHGNGEATKPANQVLSDAEQASAAASSARIGGNRTSSGTQIQRQVVDGHNRGGGTIGVDGATFQIVLDGQEVYLKADAATWTKSINASAAQLLANRWLKTTTSDQNFSSFAKLLDISQLFTNFKASGTITKEAATKVNGISVVPLKDNGHSGGTLDVASTGVPYIISISGGGQNQGILHFDEYGSASVPAVPAGAIDLNSLEQGG
jgi:hypothetical protein